MDHSGHRTNHGYLIDFIHFTTPARHLNYSLIVDLHTQKHLSTTQIAAQLGCSTSYVITTLKRLGHLRGKQGASTHPNNYRHHTPPYGHRVVGGKLKTHPGELKICRLIVDLVDRQGFNCFQAGKILEKRKIKNRRGLTAWHNYTVSQIYKRWKGKI